MKSNVAYILPLCSLGSAALIHSYIPWSYSAKHIVPRVTNTTAPTGPASNSTTNSGQAPAAAAIAGEISNGVGLNVIVQQGEIAATTDLMNMMAPGKSTDPTIINSGKVCPKA